MLVCVSMSVQTPRKDVADHSSCGWMFCFTCMCEHYNRVVFRSLCCDSSVPVDRSHCSVTPLVLCVQVTFVCSCAVWFLATMGTVVLPLWLLEQLQVRGWKSRCLQHQMMDMWRESPTLGGWGRAGGAPGSIRFVPMRPHSRTSAGSP